MSIASSGYVLNVLRAMQDDEDDDLWFESESESETLTFEYTKGFRFGTRDLKKCGVA